MRTQLPTTTARCHTVLTTQCAVVVWHTHPIRPVVTRSGSLHVHQRQTTTGSLGRESQQNLATCLECCRSKHWRDRHPHPHVHTHTSQPLVLWFMSKFQGVVGIASIGVHCRGEPLIDHTDAPWKRIQFARVYRGMYYSIHTFCFYTMTMMNRQNKNG